MAAELKSQGNQHFSAGDYDKALDCYTRAIDSDGSDHVLYSNRSGAWASLEVYDEAVNDALKCIEINPSFVKGYSRAAHAYFMQDDIEKAEEYYNKGLAIDPSNQACMEGLRKCKEPKSDMGMPGGMPGGMPDVSKLLNDPMMQKLIGDKDLQEVLRKKPDLLMKLMGAMSDPSKLIGLMNDPDPDVRTVMTKLMAGAGAGAQGSQQGSTNAEPVAPPENKPPQQVSNAEELKAQGTAAYKKRNFDEALRLYEAAYKEDETNLLIMNNMAAVFIEMGDLNKAKEVALAALEKRYDVKAPYEVAAKLYQRLGGIAEKQGNYEEAIEMYEKGLLDDNNRFIRAALADAKRKKVKADQESYFDDEKAEAHRLQGNDFFRNMKYAEAKAEYDEAIKRNPRDARIWSNRAACLQKLLDPPNALRDIEKALELDPLFIKAHARKGDILYRMKEYNKAMDAYNKGLSVDSSNVDCQQGIQKVANQIQQMAATTDGPDEETIQRAMADPEVQAIMSDPQFRMILQQGESNPEAIQKAMKDPKFSAGFQRLLGAGIIRLG